ncbi:MAG: 16S rRNA processing protein RimM [Alphaproteobacteria bacterium]|nr:16S rRNA processing protein RimM [Alphaproteobacteria bacterium]
MPSRILIAEITTAHGIKGLVKLRSYAEDAYDLEDYTLFTDEQNTTTVRVTLKNPIKGDWLAEIEGVSDRNAAEALRGTKLYIDRSQLPSLPVGKHYQIDLIGRDVVNANHRKVGTMAALQNFGAGDLLEILTQNGQKVYYPLQSARVTETHIEAPDIETYLPESA